MKNIIKFVLRMIVTACIVVGVVAVCMNFTQKNSNTTQIANASKTYNIQNRLNESSRDLYNFTSGIDGEIENKANADVVYSIDIINRLLQEYYNYYTKLSCYENSADENLKKSILDNITMLDKKITQSIKYKSMVENVDVNNIKEKNGRIINWFNALCEQTQVLFNTCSQLKQYVYTTNYNNSNCTSKKQTLLEMAKDYALVVFNAEVKYNINTQKPIDAISGNSLADFSKILNKVSGRLIDAEDGSLQEMNFIYDYAKINKAYLNEFYAKSGYQRTQYIADINNFMGQTPQDETPEQLEQRTQKAQKQQQYLSALASYISTII